QRFCGIESVYVNTDDFPFLDHGFLDDASPSAWGPLFEELDRRVKWYGARVYLTGQGGDLLMGNWIDDSDQIAGRLRRGQLKRAIAESVAWSKATRVPAPALLWRSLLANLPAGLHVGRRHDAQSGAAIPERYGDSLTAGFRRL